MANLKLSFACWDYDRTRALFNNTVQCSGVDLTHVNLPVDETFFRMSRYREFDIAEMSLSSYCVSLHTAEKPFVAIPVFPSRFFRHSCIYVNSASGIHSPADLTGKKVSCPEYQMTAPVWIRGMLQDDFGIDFRSQQHFTGGQEQPGREERFRLNLDWVQPIPNDQTLSSMLSTGEIHALYAARTPSSFDNRNVVRLFPDYAEIEREYYRRTKIFPIMHTVVIRREVYEQNPWIAQNLVTALTASKQLAYRALAETDALTTMLPWLPAYVEEARNEFGDDWWSYGYQQNLHTLQTFCRYHYEQGLSARLLDPGELFAKETLAVSKL